MKKIFLISNAYQTTEKLINSLPIEDNDTIGLFNHAAPIRFSRIKNFKNKILFLRSFPETTTHKQGYHGIRAAGFDAKLYSGFVLLNELENCTLNLHNCISYNINQLKEDVDKNETFNLIRDYPKYREHTSGLMATVFLFDKYQINFVDFTCELSKKTEDFRPDLHFHGYSFEKIFFDYLKKEQLANFFYSTR